MNTALRNIFFILLGFFVGLSLAAVILGGAFVIRTYHLARLYEIPMFSKSVENPNLRARDLLNQANQLMVGGDPQGAIDRIEPVIATWSSPVDKADGYYLLVSAEFNLADPEAAIPFAKELVENEPTGFHYLLLAQAYDSANFSIDALATYNIVLDLNEADARIDYVMVRARVEGLSTVPGNNAP